MQRLLKAPHRGHSDTCEHIKIIQIISPKRANLNHSGTQTQGNNFFIKETILSSFIDYTNNNNTQINYDSH